MAESIEKAQNEKSKDIQMTIESVDFEEAR